MSKHIPLLFTYRDRVSAKGFSADVTSHGRVLGVEEGEGDIWIYGVQPGALAANGANPKDALEAFRLSFTNVLMDFANDASSFVEFEQAVQRFFNEINAPTEQEWHAAVEAVRAGQLQISGVRTERAEAKRYVHVEQTPAASDDTVLAQHQQFSVSVRMDAAIAA